MRMPLFLRKSTPAFPTARAARPGTRGPRWRRLTCAVGLAVSILPVLPLALAQAASVYSFAGGVGGMARGDVNSGCYTSGPPNELRPFLMGGSFPAGGIAQCGLTGGFDQDRGATSGVDSHWTVGPVRLGIPEGHAGVFTGQADAKASYGVLGVRAQGVLQGGGDNAGPGTYDSMVAAAQFSDTLTATSASVANGSAGFVRYVFQWDGMASASGAWAPRFSGSTQVELKYQQSANPTGGGFGWYAQARRGDPGRLGNGAPPDGWVSGTGYIGGGSSFTSVDLPIVWGRPWDVTVGLVTTTYGDVLADFYGTARLTDVQLFNSQHQAVTDFALSAASGTNYLSPVPELGSSWLLLAGLGAMGLLRRRRCVDQR